MKKDNRTKKRISRGCYWNPKRFLAEAEKIEEAKRNIKMLMRGRKRAGGNPAIRAKNLHLAKEACDKMTERYNMKSERFDWEKKWPKDKDMPPKSFCLYRLT